MCGLSTVYKLLKGRNICSVNHYTEPTNGISKLELLWFDLGLNSVPKS